MIVNDIIPAILDVTGYAVDEALFDRISDALDVLATKGDWDGLTNYLNITADDKVVILPEDVLTPIKINLDDHPSFSRSQIYEFTMNGPTTDMREVQGWSWMDNQYSALQKKITVDGGRALIKVVNDDARDDGLRFDITVRDLQGNSFSTFVIMNSGGVYVPPPDPVPPPGPDPVPLPPPPAIPDPQPIEQRGGIYADVERVNKPITLGKVRLINMLGGGAALAAYGPNETEPQYRQIRISEGTHLKMLYKRKTYRVSSRFDYIPIKSRTALIMMVRALELFRKGKSADDLALAKGLEEVAIMRIKEDQQSRHAAEVNAAQTEVQTALDLSYNNADSVIVADIIDDAASIFGFVGREALYDRITDAIKLMNGKAMWDSLEGYVDLFTTDYQYLTLPRYVDNPLAININGRPKAMRNEWYEFHLNGPGSDMIPCDTWHFVGEVPTIRPLPGFPVSLLAMADNASDVGKEIRMFGWDQDGNRVFTQRNGQYQDGMVIPIAPHSDAPLFTAAIVLTANKITRIDRIEKDVTLGFVHLNAFLGDHVGDLPPSQSEQRQPTPPVPGGVPTPAHPKPIIPLGYYFPDETAPNYVQIRIAQKAAWVRMKYRKRQMKITSLTDPIHIKSPLAMVMAMNAVKASTSNPPDLKSAKDFEDKALQLLREEMDSRRPPGDSFSFQFQGIRSEVIL